MLVYFFNCDDCKSDHLCGSESCYEKSKRRTQICRRIFDNNRHSIFDHFSAKLSIPSVLPFIAIGFVILVVNYNIMSTKKAEIGSKDTMYRTKKSKITSEIQYNMVQETLKKLIQ